MATTKPEERRPPAEIDVESLERSPWNPYDVDEGQGRGDAKYSYDRLFDWAYAVFPEPVTIKEGADAFDASKTTLHRKMHQMEDDEAFVSEKFGGAARAFWINPDLIDYEGEDYPEPPEVESPKSYLEEAEEAGDHPANHYEHEDHGDFATHYQDDDFIAPLRQRWPAPSNKSHILDHVGCSLSLLKHRLPPLIGSNIIRKKQIAGQTSVYWVDRPDISYQNGREVYLSESSGDE